MDEAPPPLGTPFVPPSELSPEPARRVSAGALALAALAVIVLIAISSAALYFMHHRGAPASTTATMPPAMGQFAFHTGLTASTYAISGNAILPALALPDLASTSAFTVLEAGPATAVGTRAVLVSMPGHDGVTFGYLDGTDGSFAPMDADASFKQGLTVGSSGLIAFSIFHAASGVTTAGPLAAGVMNATSSGAWHVVVVDPASASSTPMDIGQGFGPRFMSDGRVVALGDEGVVAISPATKDRSVLIAVPGLIPGGYAVSADLSHIALSNPPSQTSIFTLDPSGLAAYTGSIPQLLYPVAFLPGGSLVGIRQSDTFYGGNVYSLASSTDFELESSPLFSTSSTTP